MCKDSLYICVCVCVCVCVFVCKGEKSIFKVFFYNLKTNEKPMVNNYNYCINKIFNKIILKKLSRATRGYVTSLYIYIYIYNWSLGNFHNFSCQHNI